MSLDIPFPAIPTPPSLSPSVSMQQGHHRHQQQGPTLPPDWQWICCEKDHGTSSTATATSRAPVSTSSTMWGSTEGADRMNGLPVAGFETGREKKQSLSSSGTGSRSGSRLSSPAFGSLASPQVMPTPANAMTRPHAHSRSLFLKPSSRRASGIDGQVVPLTAGATLEGQGQRHDRQNAALGWKGQHRSVRSFDTTQGSRSATPVSLYNYDHPSGGAASNSAQLQLQNQLYPTPGSTPTDSIHGNGNMNGAVGSGPGNNVLSTEAQLAQWMTYCCDKDDCVDPFPPATATSGVTDTSKDVNNPAMDGSLSTYGLGMDHVVFQAMFPGVTSTSGTAFPMPMGVADPAYCCGAGPDCHEPIVDSIGCEGHPQQCGLPECCAAPDGRCAPYESGVNGTGMDLLMKGVNWGCGSTDGMDLHGYPYRPHQMAHSGSQTPMTMGSTTQTTNTPRGAFSAQASPFLQPGNGEAQDFDIGPPAQGSSSTALAAPPSDGQLEAFLAAVAKGDFFTEEPAISNGNVESGGHGSGDTMMDHADSAMVNGHVGGQGKPLETHICHWQNCHAHFGTVQELLSHVSSEHLKITPSRPQEKPPAYQFGTTSSGGGGLESRSSSMSATGAIESRNNDVYSSLANTFGGNGFGQANGFLDAANTSGLKNDGLMACLWDDCMPGPESARPFTGAFARGSEGAVVPENTNDFAKDLESLRLLSQNATAAPSSVAPGFAHNVLPAGASSLDSSQHLHRACHVPVPVQNDNPLDSASAVLKHLLEQHLGTEATNSLLNIAQNHYTSVSAINTRENSKAAATAASSVPQIPPPRKSSHTETRPQSAQARSSDTDEKGTTFQCRWHGCDKVFDTNTALTEHISNIHVGRGKSKYECLWEGCVRCDNECDSCDEGDKMDTEEGEKRGRKFATRQKVLRHIQSHTGYRPFVCHLCGQSVSEQATLNAHLRRHAEEKPFKCDEEDCDKAFASAASLAVHKRAHMGTKTHVCPHCDRGFIELSNLTKHIRTHTGDKPFSCPLNGCGRAFCRSDQLKRHTMTCRYRKANDDDRSSTTPP